MQLDVWRRAEGGGCQWVRTCGCTCTVRVSAHGCSGVALEAGAWPSAGAPPVRVSGGLGGWRKREEKKLEMCLVCVEVYCRVCVMREGAGRVGVCGRRGFFIPF